MTYTERRSNIGVSENMRNTRRDTSLRLSAHRDESMCSSDKKKHVHDAEEGRGTQGREWCVRSWHGCSRGGPERRNYAKTGTNHSASKNPKPLRQDEEQQQEKEKHTPFNVSGAGHSAAHRAALSIFVLLCEGGDVAHTLAHLCGAVRPRHVPAERESRSV